MDLKRKIFKEYKEMKNEERKAMGESVDLGNEEGKYEGMDDEVSQMTPKKEGEEDVELKMNKVPRSGSVHMITLLFKDITKLSHSKFIKHLNYQADTIGLVFKKIANYLKYPSKANPAMVQDQVLKRSAWENYYVYVSIIELWRKNLKGMVTSLMLQSGEVIARGKHNVDRNNLFFNVFSHYYFDPLRWNDCHNTKDLKWSNLEDDPHKRNAEFE